MADEQLKEQRKANEMLAQILKDTQKTLKAQSEVLANQTAKMDKLEESFKNLLCKKNESPTFNMESLANMMETFAYDPESGSTFEKWYDMYTETFSEATELDDKARIRLLLLKLEPAVNEQYRNSIKPLTPAEKTFEETVDLLRNMFSKKISLFRTRWNCFQVRRGELEQIQKYKARVNKISEDFKLQELTPDQFKCLLFILGFQDQKDKNIRTRLLKIFDSQTDKMNLELMAAEAEHICQLEEDTQIESTSKAVVSAVQQHQHKKGRSFKPRQKEHSSSKGKDDQKAAKKIPPTPCFKCGAMHFVKDCGFTNKKCNDCGALGHKAGYCNAPGNRTRVNLVRIPETNFKVSESVTQLSHSSAQQPRSGESITTTMQFVNNTVKQNVFNIQAVSKRRKYVDVLLNGITCTLQYDTGADLTIITEQAWESIGKPNMNTLDFPPNDFQQNPIPILGVVPLQITFRGVTLGGNCLVARAHTSVFGSDWSDLFDLWDSPISTFCNKISTAVVVDGKDFVAHLKDRYSTVFQDGLGQCTAVEVRLTLRPGSQPIFRQKRTVPFHVMPLVEQELERLQQSGIITPVTFSRYAAPIVVVKKPNGGIRICGDYSTGLNDSLQQHEFPIPTPEKIFASLSNCSIFSQLDLKDAYMQLVMDKDSRDLLTINTHKGLFSFNRLVPGVRPAAGIFQETIESMLSGIRNIVIYFDDLLVATKDMQDHQDTLRAVFERLEQFNMRVRLDKCAFFKDQVRYLGIIVDSKGQRPDPDKVSAIKDMPAPTNVPELRSFLGAITFYGRFIQSMSTLRAPLDMLLRKDVPFQWTKDCKEAFQRFKDILTSELMLAHYDPSLPITIAADASSTGIGAMAYHTYPDGSIKAFYHVSKRLSPTQSRYAQIEKEALAIIFGVTRFHQYIWGRQFQIETDHRPLLSIFGSTKGVPTHTANRLQRWALTLMAYDFKIKYVGTNDFGHADVLSRLIKQQPRPDEDFIIASIDMGIGLENESTVSSEQLDYAVRSVQDITSPVQFSQIVEATKKDTVLAQVMEYVINGWPARNDLKGEDLPKYFNIRESLSVVGDCVMYRDRSVVPKQFRRQILSRLHKAHPGIVRMKSLARCFVFWPGIDADIKSLVDSCTPCQLAAKSPIKAPLSSWPIPTGPWQRVHCDFAGPIDSMWYFILVDAYSKWPEVVPMSTTTTVATTRVIKSICARFGNMETLVSDNGPQFASSAFEAFCSAEGIKHIRSPPYHPSSNGQAERFVDTFKRTLAKAGDHRENSISDFLLAYRSTPNENAPDGKSPAEIMFGRCIRVPLSSALPPADRGDLKRNTKMEDAYNRKHGAVQRTFRKGEEVLVRLHDKANWTRGSIIEPRGKVMFNVLMGDRVLRLHTNQLRRNTSCSDAGNDFPSSLLFDDPVQTQPAPASPQRSPRQRRNWRAVTRSSPPILRSRS